MLPPFLPPTLSSFFPLFLPPFLPSLLPSSPPPSLPSFLCLPFRTVKAYRKTDSESKAPKIAKRILKKEKMFTKVTCDMARYYGLL